MSGQSQYQQTPTGDRGMNSVKDYWLEIIKDIFYRKPSMFHMSGLRRTVANVSFTIPGEAWRRLGFTLEDLGYSSYKESQWMSFYFPTPEEWEKYDTKIRTLNPSSSSLFATFPLVLQGPKEKEGRVFKTKGNCILNAVVGIFKSGSQSSPECRIWIVFRGSEIVTRFGADLYFIQTLLLPRLLDVLKQVLPDVTLKDVTIFLCSAYVETFRLLTLVLWPEPVGILREAWRCNSQCELERKFIRSTVRDILKVLESPDCFSYRSRIKLAHLYRDAWLPYEQEILELWEEIKNVGN